MAGHEEQVSPAEPMPKGYRFLPKGNPFLTGQCRRMTIEEGKPLYVVTDRTKTLGLRAPKWIIHKVFEKEKTTRGRREEAVATRDSAIEKAFEDAARTQFPQMPAEDTAAMIKRALKKHSGRVGRTGTLSVNSKVRLAVGAHIRHVHTDYDNLVRQTGGGRGAARAEVKATVKELMKKWRGEQASTKSSPEEKAEKRRLRKIRKREARQAKGLSTNQQQQKSIQEAGEQQTGEPKRKKKKKKKKNSKHEKEAREAQSAIDLTVENRRGTTRTLRSSRASTAAEPILISSDTDEAVAELDDMSDVNWLQDSMEDDDDSDFSMNSVIELD